LGVKTYPKKTLLTLTFLIGQLGALGFPLSKVGVNLLKIGLIKEYFYGKKGQLKHFG